MASKAMSAITTKVFNNPHIYQLFSSVVTTRRGKEIVTKALNLDNHKRVLDFGCGLAYFADDFIGETYLGIDPLEWCIKLVKARLVNRDSCEFIVGDETSLINLNEKSFDLFFGIGVLHHMKDEQVKMLAQEIHRILDNEGTAVFLEPNMSKDCSRLEQAIMRLDRGQMARSEDAYSKLLMHKNFTIENFKFTKLLRIPYAHVLITIRKQGKTEGN